MPLYEYCCTRCGEKKEVLTRSADSLPEPTCPVCGGSMAKEWAPVAALTKTSGGGGCAPRGGFS